MHFSTYILLYFCIILIGVTDISCRKNRYKIRNGSKIEYWKVAAEDYIPRQKCNAMRSLESIGNCTTDANVFRGVKYPAYRAKCECLTCNTTIELVCRENAWIRAYNSSPCDYPACGSALRCNDELIPEELICTKKDISLNTRHCICKDACNLDEDLRCDNGTWFYPDSACGHTNSTNTTKHGLYLKSYSKYNMYKFECKNGRNFQRTNIRFCNFVDRDYEWNLPLPVCEKQVARDLIEETDSSPEPFDPYEFNDEDEIMNENESKISLSKTEISLICVVSFLTVVIFIFIVVCYHRHFKVKKSSVSSNSDPYLGDTTL